VNDGLPRLDAETQRGLAALRFERGTVLVGQVATAPVVPGRPSRRHRSFAPFFKLLRRAVAAVDVPLLEQPVRRRLVQREALGLPVRLVRPTGVWAFIPQQPEPA